MPSAAVAQTQITNTASITPPVSVTNTNPSVSCTAGVCSASDIDTVTPSSPIVSKTFTPGTISAGGTSLLTITIQNTHALTSATLTALFADVYPAGVVNFSSTAASSCVGVVPSVDANGGTLTLPINTVIPNGATCTVTTVVTSTATGLVTNTIPAGSLTTTVGANAVAGSATLTVIASANLQVTKTASTTAGTSGSTISYTVTLTNLGPSVAQNVTLTDILSAGHLLVSSSSNNGVTSTLPGGTVSATTTSLAVGGVLTLQVVATVTATTGLVTDTAVGTSTTPDGTTANNTVTLTVPVVSNADLRVTKTASTTAGTSGSTISYTVTLTNLGPSVAQNVTLTDILSAGHLLVSSSSNNGVTSTLPGGTVSATTTSLAVGGVLTLQVVATVTATTGLVTDTAVGTSTTPDGTTANNTVTLTVPVAANADLKVTKVASSATVAAGVTYSYAIVVVNAGPSVAANVTVTDVLPAGLTIVGAPTVSPAGSLTVLVTGNQITATSASLSVGTVTVTVTVVSGNQGSASVTVTNVASATSTTPDPTPTSNTGTSTVTVTPSADLATVVDLPANGVAGTVVTATVTYTNNGTSTAANVTGSVVIGTVGGTIVTLPYTTVTLVPGASVVQTVTFTVPATGPVSATSTVTTTTADPTPANNTGTDTMAVNSSADLRITKTPSSPVGTANTTITYAINLVNFGPSVAQNVTLTDVLGAGQTFISASSNNGTLTIAGTAAAASTASLQVNGTLTLLVQALVTASTGNVTDTASGTSTTPDPDTSTNTTTFALPVNASADLSVTKTASTIQGTAGSTVSYTISLVNNGPSVAQNVTLTDVLGAGQTFNSASSNNGTATVAGASAAATTATLQVGGTLMLVVQVTVTATSGNVTDTAAATSVTPDPVPANNTTTFALPVGTSADLSVTKVASSPIGTAGNTISYTISLVNLGPSVAQNVTLTDVLGTGQTFIGASSNNATLTVAGTSAAAATASLQVGSTLTLVVQATITASTGVVTDTAVGTSTTPDPSLTNNSTTFPLPVNASADLRVTKVASTAQGTAGNTISYSLTLVNFGPSLAQNVTLTDVLGTGQTFISASGNNGTITVAGTSAAASTASLQVGGTLTLVVRATITASTGAVTDTATGTSTTPDPSTPNNVTTVFVPVVSSADLSVTKVASSSIGTVGQTVNYFITFGNLGPSTAANVTVTDVLPAGLTLVGVQASSGTIGSTTASLTLGIATLPPGGSGTVTLTVSIGADAASSIVNVANISSQTPDPSTANNSATVTIGKVDSTDVRVTLTVPASATPGSTITAVVVVTNNGPSPANNVTATLTVSNGTSTTSTTVLSVVTVPSLPAGSSTTSTVPYLVPPAQTIPLTWTASVATTTTETNYANNATTATTSITAVTNASLSGRVWFDINRNRVFDNATADAPLPGFRVELIKVSYPGGVTTTTIVGTTTTGVDGRYTISGQVPGPDYRVQFRDPLGNVLYGTPFNQKTTTQNNNPSTGTNSSTAAVSPNQSVPVQGFIDNITLYVGDNVQEQNLPLDPSGIVYDSVSRQPIPGATVKLVGPAGFNPAIHLLGGSDTQVTPVFGLYQYLFINVNNPDPALRPPNGVYTLQITPPAGYTLPTPPGYAIQGGVAAPSGTYNVPAGVNNIQPQSTPPAQGNGTQYYFQLAFNFPGSGEVFNNHIPLDPLASGAILVNKTGNKTVAEIGDSVQYTIRMRNTTNQPISSVSLEDLLPAGFRYILETTRLNGATVTNPLGGVGRALTFNIGTIAAGATSEITYFVRLGVGSQQGDGINRATAVFPGATGTPVRSNTALFKVNVQGGVFSNDGCIVGKVYVDCDGNFVQNNDGGSREVGIPGVRLVMLDGTWIVTDNEGKYSMCGVKAQTQVIKVDRTTLPKGARLVPSSNRNAGVADSLFVDMKGGEMHRADFIEGSCSPEVMDEIKARRAQGGVAIPEVEKEGKALPPVIQPAVIMPATPGGVR
ncbi:MAG: DUF11 domain-containing protein [Comamonadaceae bacterium]|nr:MAG: DUF11 domain-containing protein [Comamonadaceae bacterium]